MLEIPEKPDTSACTISAFFQRPVLNNVQIKLIDRNYSNSKIANAGIYIEMYICVYTKYGHVKKM